MATPRTVDEYIASAPEPLRPMLQQLRVAIREAAPAAEERISYGMPYFHLNGRLTYFKAHANHVGLYAFTLEDARAVGLEPYATSKATLQFPFDEPLPLDAIRRLIQRRVTENAPKRRAKT